MSHKKPEKTLFKTTTVSFLKNMSWILIVLGLLFIMLSTCDYFTHSAQEIILAHII